jgi:hypothetical protein
VTWLFWIATLAAVPSAFIVSFGPARWIAIGWLGLLGAAVTISHLAMAGRLVRGGRAPSMVPLLGGPLLGTALGGISVGTGKHWLVLVALLDPWLILMIAWPLIFLRRRLTGRCS